MKIVGFRCDSSELIGTGHVMRCKKLASLFIKNDYKVFFICRKQKGDLIEDLANEFEVLTLPYINKNKKEIDNEIHPWLGCSQEKDLADTLKIIIEKKILFFDFLFIDHYAIDYLWEKSFKKAKKIIVIDDLANRKHNADYLIDQNFYLDDGKTRYKKLCNEDCKFLIGPNYALIGNEYKKLRNSCYPRKKIENILIYFGGFDNQNLTKEAFKAFLAEELKEIYINIVVHKQFKYLEDLNKIIKKRGKTNIHISLPTLGELISRSDLSIGAGGSTTLERSCLGLFNIVIPVADNQLETTKCLYKFLQMENMILDKENLSLKIKERVNYLKSNLKILQKNSFKLMTIVDGKGCERIIKMISN